MSKLEQFGLATGIIGLLSDAIALTGFFIGFWKPETSSEQGTVSTMSIFFVLTIFAMFYGWLIISWTLTRRAYVHRNKRKKFFIDRAVSGIIFTVGIFILPIFIAWFSIWATTPKPLSDYQEEAQAQATLVALLILTPTVVPESNTITPTPIVQKPVEIIIREKQKSDAASISFNFIWLLMFALVGYCFVGFLISLAIIEGMGVVYADMMHVSVSPDFMKGNS